MTFNGQSIKFIEEAWIEQKNAGLYLLILVNIVFSTLKIILCTM